MQKEYDRSNIFARIIRGELPSTKVYEDEKLIAINDINPVAPVHILVIPKGDYISFDDFIVNVSSDEIKYFFEKVRQIAHDFSVHKTGYRLVMNHGAGAGQTVPHFHVHIIAQKA